MSSRNLPENVYLLILNHVETLDALDVLLSVRRQAAPKSAEEVAAAARLGTKTVARLLEQLRGGGFVDAAGTPRLWQYIANGSLAKDVDDLAACVAKDRSNVVNLIASRNLERMKSLANAFKFGGKS